MNRRELLKAFAGVSALPMVKNVEALRLSPQDVLVITCNRDLSEDEHDSLRATLRNLFPYQKVLVLDSGLDVKVVRQ